MADRISVVVMVAVLAAVLYFGPKYLGHHGGSRSGDCYTEWDGRSNPTVCD